MNQKLRDCLAVIANEHFDDTLAAATRLTSFLPAKSDPIHRISYATHLAAKHLAEEVRELRAACAAVVEADEIARSPDDVASAVTHCRAALR